MMDDTEEEEEQAEDLEKGDEVKKKVRSSCRREDLLADELFSQHLELF